MSSNTRQPLALLCHGGGPWPLLKEESQLAIMRMWGQHRRDYFGFTYPESVREKYALGNTKAPKGVIVLSAHDVTQAEGGAPVVHVGANVNPSVEYDYDGFPDRGCAYSVTYPAHGPNGTIANEVVKELESKLAALMSEPDSKARPMKIESAPNSKLDHGVFIPLLYLMPLAESNHRDAELIDSDESRLSAAELPPVITISSFHSQDAADHIQLGRMMAGLRDMGYLVFGSGATSHVMDLWTVEDPDRGAGIAFNTALSKVLTNPDMPIAEKETYMLNFLNADGANEAQRKGQADHFMPVLTCFGAALGAGVHTAKEIANVKLGSWHEVHFEW